MTRRFHDEMAVDLIAVRHAATPDDFAQATEVLWEYVEWIRAASGLDPLAEQPSFGAELAALQATYAGGDRRLFVAVDDAGRVVGVVAVAHRPDRTSELKRLFVRPEARGVGLAGRLVAVAVAEAVMRGSASMWLESVEGFMDTAIALYRRLGFVAVDDPGRTFNVPDMVLMERLLG